jgi:hypothetical protein
MLREYLLVTNGYHLACFFNHLFSTKKNDFVEMLLHHIVAIILIGGCYIMNCWEVGAVISYLHDIADIFTQSSRVLIESNYKSLTYVSFGFLIISWFETRLYMFPQLIYSVYEA